MDRYIKQIIEDIEEAKKMVPLPSDIYDGLDEDTDKGEIEDLSYIEQYLNGPEKKIEDITGIKKELLPPPEKLTEGQIEALTKALISLWKAFYLVPDFPEGVPDRIKYPLLRDYCEHETKHTTMGEVHVEFCDCDPENCPFEGYCSICKEIEKESLPEQSDIAVEDDVDFFPTKDEIDTFVSRLRKEKIRDFLENYDNKNYIPGIHNYCDRWCEHCNFTKKCMSFLMEQELFPDENNLNDTLDSVRDILEVTFELLEKEIEKRNIPPDELEQLVTDEAKSDHQATEHPLNKLADKYVELTDKKFIKHIEDIRSGLIHIEHTDTAKEINNNVEIILWYFLFIKVKLQRALGNLLSQDEFMVDDMNGSAKVALLSIDRSIEAWQILLKHLSNMEDEILEILSVLSQLRKQSEQTFPDARNFRRPGFDDDNK